MSGPSGPLREGFRGDVGGNEESGEGASRRLRGFRSQDVEDCDSDI